jgi:hypothetical protein
VNICTQEKGKEIFDYLKTQFEIPENVISLSLHLGLDQLPTLDVTYYPIEKQNPNG